MNTITAALVVRITRLIVIVIAIGLVLPTPLPVRAAGIRYAVSDGATSGTCERWANACTLKYALSIAVSGDQIWVQRGVHYPGATQYDSFVLKGGVAVYGGFDGTETNFDQRNPSRNKTILSGDVDRNDNDRDRNGIIEPIKGEYNDGRNANYVVMVREPGAVLDGFIITAGVGAYGSTYGNLGGGMYSSAAVTVASCIFVGNGADSGGGMAAIGNSPVLRNVMFIGNQARWGGGMYNEYSSPQLVNVVFNGNIATIAGGGMYNHFSSPTLTNVTFSENSIQSRDGGWGGGMYNSYSSNPTLRNVIMWLNRATNGPEIFNGPNSPVISYSNIKGCIISHRWVSECGTDGGHNKNVDPRFKWPLGFDRLPGTLDDDLHLLPESPAIDAGNNAAVPAGVTTDLDGNPRFVDIPTFPDTGSGTPPTVDMGAYEVQDTIPPSVLAINRADPNPTNVASVAFIITFSEAVSGVDVGDFALTTTDSISGASVTGVSGTGSTYTITVSTGTGFGTLRLDVPATASITDLEGNGLSGLPYTSGQAYQKVAEVFLPLILQ